MLLSPRQCWRCDPRSLPLQVAGGISPRPRIGVCHHRPSTQPCTRARSRSPNPRHTVHRRRGCAAPEPLALGGRRHIGLVRSTDPFTSAASAGRSRLCYWRGRCHSACHCPAAVFTAILPSAVLSDPAAAAVFALVPPSAVLADPAPAALLALAPLTAMHAEPAAATLLARAPRTAVLADPAPPAVFAAEPLATVLADPTAAAVLAPALPSAMLADPAPAALLALSPLMTVLADAPAAAVLAPILDSAV
jgi:hypothetical protein